MNRNFDISKVFFVIRKATSKRYNRCCIYRQRDKRYKLTITSSEADLVTVTIAAVINHECNHVILGELISIKAFDTYDKYLKNSNLYNEESLLEYWI